MIMHGDLEGGPLATPRDRDRARVTPTSRARMQAKVEGTDPEALR